MTVISHINSKQCSLNAARLSLLGWNWTQLNSKSLIVDKGISDVVDFLSSVPATRPWRLHEVL